MSKKKLTKAERRYLEARLTEVGSLLFRSGGMSAVQVKSLKKEYKEIEKKLEKEKQNESV